jgi:hypothetical protein
MTEETYLIRFKHPELCSQSVMALSAKIQGEHIVLTRITTRFRLFAPPEDENQHRRRSSTEILEVLEPLAAVLRKYLV